ncbi:tetratricopeptide repeat protein [Fodinibius sediminis]|uniref:Uncharacterized protein n=1 Tax=Fodinibius sediminis TaxID=1214077 RepID=A0A521AHJ5_9BACT|nr:tetratricopeptide repeat protein [Fodinibius sediminis]SMO34241.1 hypothetical protein SAMN06265218_101122 [Fodinibius sediminis]
MNKERQSKIKQLARQIKKNPKDSFSKFALALEFRKQGAFGKARILFEDILKNDPDYIGVYYHLGKLYEMHDRLSDARKMYKLGIPKAEQQQKLRTKSELQEALQHLEFEMDN